jgi:WD40 repeat protein
MAHFRKLVLKLKEIIQSFKEGDINIVICNLSLDSLVAGVAMKYYILCVNGNNRRVKIYCDDNFDDPLLQSVCRFFNLSCNREIKSISNIVDNGNNIFINWGSYIFEKIPNIKPSIVIGNVCEKIVHSPNDKTIFLGNRMVSVSAIMFKIFSETENLQSLKKDENLPFLLALSIEYDTNRISGHASHNLCVLGRIMGLVGFSRFHDFIEKLPEDILKLLKLN